MEELIEIVCRVTNVRRGHILSDSRASKVAYARFYLIYLLHNVYEVKVQNIAELLDRTPSAIRKSLGSIERLQDEDVHFKETLQTIVDQCPEEIPTESFSGKTKALTNRELLLSILNKINQLEIQIQNLS